MPASRAATAICSAPLEWPSRPGLATSSFGGPPAIVLTRSTTAAKPGGRTDRAGDAGRGAELAEHLAHHRAPLAGRAAGLGQGDRRRHHVVAVARRPPQLVERRGDGGVVAAGPPPLDVGDRLGLDGGVDAQDGALAAERRRLGLGEAVDADDDQVAGLDAPGPLGHRRHEAGLQRVDGLERAAHRQHVVELVLRRVAQLGRARLDDVRAVEEVVVLEEVGLERQHLLHPQRPLLVPRVGAGRAPRSTPAAGCCAPWPAWTSSRRASPARCAGRCSPAGPRSGRGC